VSLDDRTADRQAHPHAIQLGGEKRAEQLSQLVRGDDLTLSVALPHERQSVRHATFARFFELLGGLDGTGVDYLQR
jgi:hypothetical protein